MPRSEQRRPQSVPRRPSTGRLIGLIALIWAVAVAFVLTVASDTRIGPVIYRITATHGIHLGDLYAMLGCAAIALLLTVWAVMDHQTKKRRYARYQAFLAREEERAAAVHESEEDSYDSDSSESYESDASDHYAEQYDDHLDDRYEPEHDEQYVEEPYEEPVRTGRRRLAEPVAAQQLFDPEATDVVAPLPAPNVAWPTGRHARVQRAVEYDETGSAPTRRLPLGRHARRD